MAACSAHDFLLCDCAISSDVAGADTGFGIAEEESLQEEISLILKGKFRGLSSLTANTLSTLTTIARTPAEMIMRQKAMPIVSWAMALVFKFPKVETPRIIMIPARV